MEKYRNQLSKNWSLIIKLHKLNIIKLYQLGMCYVYLNDEVGSKKQYRIDVKVISIQFSTYIKWAEIFSCKRVLSKCKKLLCI